MKILIFLILYFQSFYENFQGMPCIQLQLEESEICNNLTFLNTKLKFTFYPIKFTFNRFHPLLPPSFTFAQSYLLSPLSSISIHFRWISKFLVRVTSVKVFSRYPHSLGPHQNKSQSVNESVTRITSRAAYAAKKYKTLETYLFCSANLPIQYLKLSLN